MQRPLRCPFYKTVMFFQWGKILFLTGVPLMGDPRGVSLFLHEPLEVILGEPTLLHNTQKRALCKLIVKGDNSLGGTFLETNVATFLPYDPESILLEERDQLFARYYG
jgi:hypothetical protein